MYFDDIVRLRFGRLAFPALPGAAGKPAIPRIRLSPLDTCDVHARLIGENGVWL